MCPEEKKKFSIVRCSTDAIANTSGKRTGFIRFNPYQNQNQRCYASIPSRLPAAPTEGTCAAAIWPPQEGHLRRVREQSNCWISRVRTLSFLWISSVQVILPSTSEALVLQIAGANRGLGFKGPQRNNRQWIDIIIQRKLRDQFRPGETDIVGQSFDYWGRTNSWDENRVGLLWCHTVSGRRSSHHTERLWFEPVAVPGSFESYIRSSMTRVAAPIYLIMERSADDLV
jgi:hypothetical protein